MFRRFIPTFLSEPLFALFLVLAMTMIAARTVNHWVKGPREVKERDALNEGSEGEQMIRPESPPAKIEIDLPQGLPGIGSVALTISKGIDGKIGWVSEGPNTPAEDDAAYWGPIVQQRLVDFEAVIRFVKKHLDEKPGTRLLIYQPAIKVFSRAVGRPHLFDSTFFPIDEEVPRNALWAGLLKHARHVVEEQVRYFDEELGRNLPLPGEPGGDSSPGTDPPGPRR